MAYNDINHKKGDIVMSGYDEYFGLEFDDYEDDEIYEPELVDRSLNIESILEQFERTKNLLADNAELAEKLAEIEQKVKEYRAQLMQQVGDLQNKVKKQFEQSFEKYFGTFDDAPNSTRNLFYKKISEVSFSKKYFDKFVAELEQNYGESFEVVKLKSKSTKTFEEYEHHGYETYYIQKHFCASLIVPKSISGVIKHKYANIKESDLKTLCKQPNIFLVASDWCSDGGWDEERIFGCDYELDRVFSHLNNCYGLTVNKLSQLNAGSNLYYKDDKRFTDSIFATLKFYNKEVKKEDEKENREMLKRYKKQLEKKQKRYEEMLKEL